MVRLTRDPFRRRTANPACRSRPCTCRQPGSVSAQADGYGQPTLRRPHAPRPASVSRPGAHQMCSERAASARRPCGAWRVGGLGSPESAPEWAKPPPHHGLWCAQHLNNSGDLGEGAIPAGVRCTSQKSAVSGEWRHTATNLLRRPTPSRRRARSLRRPPTRLWVGYFLNSTPTLAGTPAWAKQPFGGASNIARRSLRPALCGPQKIRRGRPMSGRARRAAATSARRRLGGTTACIVGP